MRQEETLGEENSGVMSGELKTTFGRYVGQGRVALEKGIGDFAMVSVKYGGW